MPIVSAKKSKKKNQDPLSIRLKVSLLTSIQSNNLIKLISKNNKVQIGFMLRNFDG